MRFLYRWVISLSLAPIATAPSLAASGDAAGSRVAGLEAVFAPPSKGFRFEDSAAVDLTLAEIPTRIRVLNQTTETIRLRAELDGLEPTATGCGEGSHEVLALDPEPVELPPAGSAEIELRLLCEEARLAAGSYRGYLVLYCRKTAKLARKEIRLSTVDGYPEPLRKKWEIRYWRALPFSSWLVTRDREDAFLPFFPSGSGLPETASRSTPIGYLVSDDRHEAAVVREAGWEDLDGDLQGARLKVKGIDRYTSQYEGTIDFQPHEAGGEVELTVSIKDHWSWALACLILGILAARQLQYFLRTGRSIGLARERELELGQEFKIAHIEFEKRTAGTAFAGFSIANGLAAERRKIRVGLDQVQLLGFKDQALDSQPDFQAAQQRLEDLEAIVDSWPEFPRELQNLEAARDELEAVLSGSGSPPDVDGPPRCLKLAEELLTPEELTVAAYERYKQRVTETMAVLPYWGEIEQEVQVLLVMIAALQGQVSRMGPSDVASFRAAAGGVDASWRELWRKADSLEEVTQIGEELDNSYSQIHTLAKFQTTTGGPSSRSAAAASMEARSCWRRVGAEGFPEL